MINEDEIRLDLLFEALKKEQESLYGPLDELKKEVVSLEQALSSITQQKNEQLNKLSCELQTLKALELDSSKKSENAFGFKHIFNHVESYFGVMIFEAKQRVENSRVSVESFDPKIQEVADKITEKNQEQLKLLLEFNEKITAVKNEIIQLILTSSAVKSKENFYQASSSLEINSLNSANIKYKLADVKEKHVQDMKDLEILKPQYKMVDTLNKFSVFQSPLKKSANNQNGSDEVRVIKLAINFSEKFNEASEKIEKLEKEQFSFDSEVSKFRLVRVDKALEEQLKIETALANAMAELKVKQKENIKLNRDYKSLMSVCLEYKQKEEKYLDRIESYRSTMTEYETKISYLSDQSEEERNEIERLKLNISILEREKSNLENECEKIKRSLEERTQKESALLENETQILELVGKISDQKRTEPTGNAVTFAYTQKSSNLNDQENVGNGKVPDGVLSPRKKK